MPAKTAVLYLRQSVTRKGEDSVSIDTQRDKCRAWAESQGYRVVGEFTDPNTSGSKVPPTGRKGWQALLRADFNLVVVYKIDRISRNFLQFWDTVKALEADGRTLASVNESLDLGKPVGKIVASVLAGVAEMTADDISIRVADARAKCIADGRAVGGKVPYGWMTVPIDKENPKRGKVTVQDPETIDWVRGMVERARAGMTVYGISQWLTREGAPTPAGVSATFRPSTVERILRHPILAGMVPFNPGRTTEKTRGDDVLRGDDGLPVVHPNLAVMSTDDWRKMVARLDNRDGPQARPRSACATTSPLLSGLIWCAACDQRMWRASINGRPGYRCNTCGQNISGFEDVVVEEVLATVGDLPRFAVVEVIVEGGTALLPEIEHRLDELARLIREAPDRERRAELQAEQATLLDLRDEKRAEAPVVEYRQVGTDNTIREDYEAATTVEDRRAVLDFALARVLVSRGRTGRRTRESLMARLDFQFQVGQHKSPSDEEMARWAEAG